MRVEIVDYQNAQHGIEFRQRIMQASFGVTAEQDKDAWDQVAQHFVVWHGNTVVGYYRAIVDSSLGFYTETEFDLDPLNIPRNKILEIGRAAADPNFRHAGILPRLWGELIDYAMSQDCRYLLGAASLKPQDTAVNAVVAQWRDRYQYHLGQHAVPKNPYNQQDLSTDTSPPKLVQVYEKIGASIVSDASWDPVFQTADVITVLDLDSVNQRWMERLL